MKTPRTLMLLAAAALIGILPTVRARAEALSSQGQVLYVPIYSELAYGDRGNTLNLSATLSVRNTDRRAAIRLKRVDYYGVTGKLLRSHTAEPRMVAPMASAEFIISGADRSGGTAASFIVEWASDAPVSPPVVEAVMISAQSVYGVSFMTSARVLEDHR
jgi:hypothetical protein